MAIASNSGITIRELDSITDLKWALTLEREVWGLADVDAIPITLAIAAQAAGAMWLGAFQKSQLAGFAFAVPSLERGVMGFHSHMLGVRVGLRGTGIGFALKTDQRQRALALGVTKITWTFDPLRAANAHFNFSRLGVICDDYRVDFYGSRTSSPLHTNGTDRLWVTWPLTERRVEGRLRGTDTRADVLDALSHFDPLIRFGGDGQPVKGDLSQALARERITIEIPGDIGLIERDNLTLAKVWRLAVRRAFTEALKAGFVVTEFCRSIRGQQGPGAYLLAKTVDGSPLRTESS